MTAQGVDEAINRVLQAEEEAREAVAACRQEAKDMVKRARVRAAWILERADGRTTAVRERCERCVSGQVARIESEARLALHAGTGDAALNGLLDQALERLADEVVGAGS